jgi:chemotaxis signal transduction protein
VPADRPAAAVPAGRPAATVPADRADAAVLAERAAALAVPPAAGDEDTAAQTVLTVAIGDERYGIDAARVVEVQTLAGLSRVPGLADWWAGVVNVRGTLRAVLDLARFLAVPAASRPEPKKVTYVAGAGLVVGLLVDDAVELSSVPPERLGPPPAGSTAAARGHVRGTTADLLTVLDVDRLLADPRLAGGEEPG